MILGLSACSKPVEVIEENTEFNTWINSLPAVIYDSKDNAMNQLFIDKVAAGFEDIGYEWLVPTLEENAELTALSVELTNQLHDFDTNTLTKRQKITYDVVEYGLSDSITKIDDTDLFYLSNDVLGQFKGVMSDIALTLYFFTVRNQKDADSVLHLIETMPEYATKLVAFEQERQDNGFGMSPAEIENVLPTYLEQTTNDVMFLADNFQDQILSADYLDDTQKVEYIETYRSLINNKYHEAFQIVWDGLNNLDVKQKDYNNLTALSSGKEYYQFLIEQYTGYTDMDAYVKYLEEKLEKKLMAFQSIYMKHPEYIEDYIPTFTDYEEPNDLLTYISEQMKNDFPAISETDFVMNYLPSEFLSLMPGTAAFYMLSPYDSHDQQEQMMIVGSRADYVTIAHEGYPGHMYQHIYSKEKGLPIIQSLMGGLAYGEGYANYVGSYATKYSSDAEFEKFYDLNNDITYLLFLQLEYRANYLGEDVSAELAANFGLEIGTEGFDSLYDFFLYHPGIFMAYYIGKMQFEDLQADYQKKQGSNYSDLDFHTQILDLGNMPISMVREYVMQ